MKFAFILLILVFPPVLRAQTIHELTLEQAYDLAEKNYPAIKRKELVKRTTDLNIENLGKGFLPQVTISGQATYQSDVTRIPISLPGLNIESASKDQYKLLADVNQLVYDGGATRAQKDLQRLNESVEQQKIEVELYQVKGRIDQLFLGGLLLDHQLKQVDLVKQDIQAGIKRVDAQVQNGVSFRSNLNLLKAELLKAEQRKIEISSTRTGLLEALAQFLGQELPADVRLITPLASIPADSILRPELKLYDEQSRLLAGQSQWIKARNLPKASVFGQAGYGKPGLNMLKNDFDLYYIAGVRLSWSISGLYTKKNEEEQVSINRKIVETQKETFLLNTNAQLKQEAAEIDKLQKLVETDNVIVDLRRSVTDAAKAQLDNAVITATDYLNQVNAEDQARQTMILHELQLLQARITYERTKGH